MKTVVTDEDKWRRERNLLESADVSLLRKQLVVQTLFQCRPLGGAVVLQTNQNQTNVPWTKYKNPNSQPSYYIQDYIYIYIYVLEACLWLPWQLGSTSHYRTVLLSSARPPYSKKTRRSRRTRCCWSWWEPGEAWKAFYLFSGISASLGQLPEERAVNMPQ